MTTLKHYLGLCINTGILRKNIALYWSKKFGSQSAPFFRAVMPFRKFEMMQRFLHVGTLDTPACGQPGFDPWSKVRVRFSEPHIQEVLCAPHSTCLSMRVWCRWRTVSHTILTIRYKKVWTLCCWEWLCATRRIVCGKRLPHPQRHGAGPWCRHGLDAEGEPSQ